MRAVWLAVLLALTLMLSGCDAIQGIFQAGFFVGIIVVVLVLAGIGFLAMKMRR